MFNVNNTRILFFVFFVTFAQYIHFFLFINLFFIFWTNQYKNVYKHFSQSILSKIVFIVIIIIVNFVYRIFGWMESLWIFEWRRKKFASLSVCVCVKKKKKHGEEDVYFIKIWIPEKSVSFRVRACISFLLSSFLSLFLPFIFFLFFFHNSWTNNGTKNTHNSHAWKISLEGREAITTFDFMEFLLSVNVRYSIGRFTQVIRTFFLFFIF